MARILRRRIARHTPSAMSRRDTASEINQWLKLGLTAAQIGERLIPDDPTMTKEQMHAIIRARMAGADAPPSAARRVVDAAIEEYKPLSQTGPTLSGAPAGAPPTEAERVAYQDAIDRSLGQSAAEGASSQASPTPRPLTPPTAPVLSLASEDPNAVREGRFLPPGKMGLDYGQAPPSRLGLDLDYGVPEPYTPIPTIAPAEQERQALAEIGAGEQLASNILGSVGVEPAVEPGSPQAQAVANDTIKELAVEAPKAATSADEVIAMYDKLVEASGPRGFFERLGFGMGARMDAVNKACMANLNKSPLARKGSGAELRAATALVLQSAREAEGAKSRGAKAAAVTAANKESDRRFKRSQKEYDRRLSKQKGKDLAAFERRVRLKIFEGLLEGKDGKLPTPAKRAIEAQMKARRTLAGEAAKLEEIKKDFPGGEEGLNEAIASYRESGRVSSKYDNAWSLYYPVLLNYKMAKAEMDKQEELIQEYATRTGTFIPPLTALNEEVNAKLKEGVGADSGSAVITNKARQAMLNSGMPPEQVDRILGKKRVSLEEATDIAGSKFQR